MYLLLKKINTKDSCKIYSSSESLQDIQKIHSDLLATTDPDRIEIVKTIAVNVNVDFDPQTNELLVNINL